MRLALSISYALVVMMLLCGLTIGACLFAFRGHVRVVEVQRKITNKTSLYHVQQHFKTGAEYSQFPAQSLGMRDGTCYAFTNHVSWLALECFGTVNP